MRWKDPQALARRREAKFCELCGEATPGGCDPAHVLARGMGGGGSDMDVNLVSACRRCHRLQHDGHIKRLALLQAVCRREKIAGPEQLLSWLFACQGAQSMKHHPVCDLWPDMDEDEFTELVEDIRKHGCREAIAVLNGKLLGDGKNRMRACEIIGIKPPVKAFTDEEEFVAYCISKNGPRRNLKPGQKAAAIVKVRQYIAEREAKGKKTNPEIFPGDTRAAVARNAGVNEHYISDAQKVQKFSDDLFEEVVDGTKTLPEALKVVKEASKPKDKAKAKTKPHPAPKPAPKKKEKSFAEKASAALGELMRAVDDWADGKPNRWHQDILKSCRIINNTVEAWRRNEA